MHKVRLSFFIIFLLMGIFLCFYPGYDIAFSDIFHKSGLGFIHKENFFVSSVFRFVPFITKFCAAFYIILIFIKAILGRSIIKTIKSPLIFLLISLLLGPGLVVNYALKENFGRARPREIVEFGGNKEFTRALSVTDQCQSNCSFSSGHAAMGFYFTSLAWIAPIATQNFAFIITFLFGGVVGLGRILQGGHFLSDIVFSFVIVLFVNEISYRLWIYLKNKFKEKNADKT